LEARTSASKFRLVVWRHSGTAGGSFRGDQRLFR
jgi:hypothetical protein